MEFAGLKFCQSPQLQSPFQNFKKKCHTTGYLKENLRTISRSVYGDKKETSCSCKTKLGVTNEITIAMDDISMDSNALRCD